MNTQSRNRIIATVTRREELRPLGRVARLLKRPFQTLPYYALATLGHIRPFRIRFKTLWGTSMTSYLPEGNTFYYYGFCEANLTNFLLRYIQEGFICIDVGAHIGYYSMLFSELVGKTGSVYSFEPTPWTYMLLIENTKQLHNVRAENYAVSDTEAVVSFADYGPGYGAYNTAHDSGAAGISKQATITEVTSITLDSYCVEHSIIPDLIKIDAEGFEYHVLSGMQELCNTSRDSRPLITLEVAGGDWWKENREKSLRFLSEHSYILLEMLPSGLLSRTEAKDDYTYDNLLFVPQEHVLELHSLLS